MKKTETLFVGICLIAVLVVTGTLLVRHGVPTQNNINHVFPTSNYGAFLAAQHAVYVNDFDNAIKFTDEIKNVDYNMIKNTRYLAEFLGGRMPADIELLGEEKSAAASLIYDAHLVSQDKWDALYKRHKKDESALSAPLRIWSSVATKNYTDATKFIEKLPTNGSWKSFVLGQIYAERGDIDRAAKYFAGVAIDFMNINDYMYIMSFYRAHGLDEDANTLHRNFTLRPAGMFMLNYDDIPAWETFSGYKNALAFSLIQNVSHTQIMMFSDLSILLLRFAQMTGPAFNGDNDAINYYLGNFFFNNAGNYEKFFKKIGPKSPFYLFAVSRMAERNNDYSTLERAAANNPLFVPATNRLIAHYISRGDKRAALRVINRALDNENLDQTGRAFFQKSRAQIYYAFGDYDAALSDIHDAAGVLPMDAEILSLQAKIWVAQNREIESAYSYAMLVVQKNPADILGWDTLGRVIAVREGVDAALDLLERVGEVSNSHSALFEQLGDLYAQKGDLERARQSYTRAIELSDDGLTIIKNLQKKLRKLK